MAEVIASTDTIVYDEPSLTHRKLFAGQPVPPDLVAAYEDAGGKPVTAQNPAADPTDDMTVADLRAALDAKGLDTEGKKAELVERLRTATPNE